jgi:hypothetical protein
VLNRTSFFHSGHSELPANVSDESGMPA